MHVPPHKLGSPGGCMASQPAAQGVCIASSATCAASKNAGAPRLRLSEAGPPGRFYGKPTSRPGRVHSEFGDLACFAFVLLCLALPSWIGLWQF